MKENVRERERERERERDFHGGNGGQLFTFCLRKVRIEIAM